MKRISIIILCLAMLTVVFAGCNKTTPYDDITYTTSTDGTAAESDARPTVAAEFEMLSGKHYVEIDVKDYGTIKVELDADVAPITVSNFVDLVNIGFYDGLTFHRIIDGFMIQGGDPNGTGTGGSGRPIKGEFINNGVENNISHVRGVISMARASANDSASSQFFIVHKDYPSLDKKYAGFGRVTEGMEVVDAICEDVAGWNANSNGVVPKKNQPVINYIKVIEG
ncbi:MAG: peptidylprolyl isomerase [Oscillospiraceae bacterium]|nr:peptidylprolyl isomerase [Oscillospiraceae bacterium]